VAYVKPKERPTWMREQDYDQLPDEIVVRELRYRIERPGFRTRRGCPIASTPPWPTSGPPPNRMGRGVASKARAKRCTSAA